jgi:hypothetical protein
MGMSQGSSSALTRQFRNGNLGSSDALNALIPLEHTRIFIFLSILLSRQKINLIPSGSSLKAEVQLRQIKNLLLDGFWFEQHSSSITHTEKFSCM